MNPQLRDALVNAADGQGPDLFAMPRDLAVNPMREEGGTRETADLAIAACGRALLANETSFQWWLRGETEAMSLPQKRGTLVFFSQADA